MFWAFWPLWIGQLQTVKWGERGGKHAVKGHRSDLIPGRCGKDRAPAHGVHQVSQQGAPTATLKVYLLG